jgi:hypothetical protein
VATLPSPNFPYIAPSTARRTRRLRTTLVASVLAVGVLAPTAAFAGAGTKVVTDCADDSKLSKKYTAAEYADALKNIPTDVDEYTDCRDVIKRAQLGLGTGSSGGSGGGSGGSGGGTGSSGSGSGGGATGGGAATGDGASSAASNGLNDYDATLAGASAADRAAITQATGTAPDAVQIGGQELQSGSLSHGDLGSLNSLPAPLVVVLLLLALGTVAAGLPKIRSFVRTRLQRAA